MSPQRLGRPCGGSAGLQNVYRDPKGFPEWKAAGLPVESMPAESTASH